MGYINYDEPRSAQRILRDIDAVLLARHALRQAILEVLEAGDNGMIWGCFHPFSAVAQDARERFASAVIQRLGNKGT